MSRLGALLVLRPSKQVEGMIWSLRTTARAGRLAELTPFRRVSSYVGRRLLQAIPIILGIVALNFVMLHLAPGNEADVAGAGAGAATPEYMEALRGPPSVSTSR